MLRVSVSDVDAYRYWLGQEDADVASLLSRLRREEPPTEAMLAGTALHKALELSEGGDFDTLEADGFVFHIETDADLALPMLRELKAEKSYLIDGEVVVLVGKVDALYGQRVEDHKFTGRFDAEKFIGTFQWRFYLDIFDADSFRWNVFEGREFNERDHSMRHTHGDPRKHYVIYGAHKLEQHRYPGMAQDCRAALSEFVSFARTHLPERFTKEAA